VSYEEEDTCASLSSLELDHEVGNMCVCVCVCVCVYVCIIHICI